MAAMAEERMNLAVLQQRDPYITAIMDTAKQVALYSFSSKENEWMSVWSSISQSEPYGPLVGYMKQLGHVEAAQIFSQQVFMWNLHHVARFKFCSPDKERTSIEGTLFVYRRSATPINGFLILNRLGPNNLTEPITKDLEFQLQDPFLLYRNVKAIYGIWFYDKDECARVGQLMNSLVQMAIANHQAKSQVSTRQRRASESDTMEERVEKEELPKSRQVDIIQLLSKAQHEYNKAKDPGRCPEPKPMTDKPDEATTNCSNIIRPTPVRAMSSGEDAGNDAAEGSSPTSNGAEAVPVTSQISLEALFRNASLQQTGSGGNSKPVAVQRSVSVGEPESVASSNQLPSIFKHLASTGSMVEDIERQQRGEVASLRTCTTTTTSATTATPVSNFFGQGSEPKHKRPSPLHISRSQKTYNFPPSPKVSTYTQLVKSASSSNYSTGQEQQDVFRSSLARNTLDTSALTLLENINTGQDTAKHHVSPVLQQVNKNDTLNSGLLTPADLETSGTGFSLAGGSTHTSSQLSTHYPAELLLSPMAFTSPSVRTTSASSSSSSSSDSARTLEPVAFKPATAGTLLTKEQLQQTLIDLLKNDANFLTIIHEAYLQKLKAERVNQKS